MLIETVKLTRAQVAEILGMSNTWVAIRMRAGDLPRPGQAASAYVAAFARWKAGRRD